jgi:hypothetical protein
MESHIWSNHQEAAMKVPIIIKPALLRATIGLVGFIILLTGRPAQAATLNVNTADDEVAGTNCSLREAVAAVNMGHDAFGCKNFVRPDGTSDPYGFDYIFVPAFTISLSRTAGTIHFSNGFIQGAGYLKTIIDGHNLSLNDSAITIGNGHSGSVFLSGLTIQNSLATGLTVAVNSALDFSYGRILNTGNLTQSSGGCIHNMGGNVSLSWSELKGCKSSDNGGGILNDSNGILIVDNTTIHECTSGLDGGGIANIGGSAGINNSTLANNLSRRGAGFFEEFGGSASLEGVTIAYNENTQLPGESSPPSALFSSSFSTNDALGIFASIVAKNSAPNVEARWEDAANCGVEIGSNPIISGGYNILGDPGDDICPGQLTSGPNMDIQADPNFVTSADTFTFADGSFAPHIAPEPAHAGGVGPVYIPNQGSPALSRVATTELFCLPNFSPMTDERSVSRLKDGNSKCDIGAATRSSALFVVANPAAPSAGDLVVKNTLTNLGFDVTMADGNTVTSNSAAGKAIVVISKSVVNTRFAGATFRDVTIGALVMNPFDFHDMGMTGPIEGTDFGSSGGQTNIGSFLHSSLDDQPIGDPIGDLGTPQVTSSPQTYGWAVPTDGTPNSFGASPGPATNSSAVRTWVFDGFGPEDAGRVFARRVSFFATQAACAALTDIGRRLLEEAIITATHRELFFD